MKFKRAWLPHWTTFLSASFLVLSFPPWNFTPLLFIGLIPWLYRLEISTSNKDTLIQGFWMGWFTSLGGFFWVSYVLKQFGGLPWSVAIIFLLLFCTFNHAHFLIFAGAFRIFREKLSKRILPKVSVLTAIYICIDQLIPNLFIDELGNGAHNLEYIRQIADLSGVSILTALVVFTNFSLYYWWKAEGLRTKQWKPLLPLFVVWIFSFTYGMIRYNEFTREIKDADDGVNFALIQGNIGDLEKLASEQGLVDAADKVVKTYLSLSTQALQLSPKPDFVVWPETAYPSRFRSASHSTERIRDQAVELWVKENKTPLLFGGYHSDQRYEYNALFFLYPNQKLQIYMKSILLLFGETLPFVDTFPALGEAFPQVGNFGKGPGAVSMDVERAGKAPLKMHPLICYEVLFSSFVRDGINAGADIMLNITNDSWFGPLGEPQLHFALANLRTVETRRPLVRSTNTGITGIVLPNGDVLMQSEIGKAEIFMAHVPLTQEPHQTLYLRLGNWFGWLMWLVLGGFLVLAKRSRQVSKF